MKNNLEEVKLYLDYYDNYKDNLDVYVLVFKKLIDIYYNSDDETKEYLKEILWNYYSVKCYERKSK